MVKNQPGIAYNDDAIQVLEGLEAVRKRPGMYIGSTDSRGLHHLVFEIVDNAVDEALAGFGNHITVKIHEDNSITVRDFGRGMPTGMHKMGKPTPEIIFTVLHAGGKFGQGGYKTSGGLHGVGSSVVNALSTFLEVTIHREGEIFRQRFENGGKPVTSLDTIGKTKETGTLVHFLPDETIFSVTKYNYDTLAERLRESAFLLKGLKIELIDERGEGKHEVFHYENGIEAFVSYLNEEKDVLHPVKYVEGLISEIEVEFAFQFNDGYSETILSFVNNVRTKDGGTHETGAKAALTRVFNEYA
ncbi:MAG: ATP-binding protein, partial [Solibacillus sp.]